MTLVFGQTLCSIGKRFKNTSCTPANTPLVGSEINRLSEPSPYLSLSDYTMLSCFNRLSGTLTLTIPCTVCQASPLLSTASSLPLPGDSSSRTPGFLLPVGFPSCSLLTMPTNSTVSDNKLDELRKSAFAASLAWQEEEGVSKCVGGEGNRVVRLHSLTSFVEVPLTFEPCAFMVFSTP